MSDQVYCYHCRRHHPAAEVRLIQTGGVKRWRCLKSIALSRGSTVTRDAFGQAVSASNRSGGAGARPLPRAVIELFGSARAAA